MFSEVLPEFLTATERAFSGGGVREELVLRALEDGVPPDLRTAARLLQLRSEEARRHVARVARERTLEIHGRRIGLIAPLYFSNECRNDCSTCDMSVRNSVLKRRTLSTEEFVAEVMALRRIGYQTIEIVGGSFALSDRIGSRFLDCLRSALEIVPDLAVFVDTLSPEEYRLVASPEITLIHWQESYFRSAYRQMVRGGPKVQFARRLDAHDLFLQSGGMKVGLSVLAGLTEEYERDVFLCIAHAMYLESEYGVPPACFGTVRISPADRMRGEDFFDISVDRLCHATAVLRLMFPYANVIATSRETQETILRQIQSGATFTNTVCTTAPGGYVAMEQELPPGPSQFAHESPAPEIVKCTVGRAGRFVDWSKRLRWNSSLCGGTACCRDSRMWAGDDGRDVHSAVPVG